MTKNKIDTQAQPGIIDTIIGYFSKRALPYWSVLFLDLILLMASGLVVYTLNHGAVLTIYVFYHLLATLAIYLPCYIIGFRLFHTYARIIRYTSFIDLHRIAIAVFLGMLLQIVMQYILCLNQPAWLVELSFSDIIESALLAIALIVFVRIWVKLIYQAMIHRTSNSVNAFIYGVRDGGVAIAKSINTQDNAPFKLVGFVSDESDMRSKMLMGVKVYSNNDTLVRQMKKNNVEVLLVSPLKSEELRANNAMVDSILAAGIKIFMFPSAQEWDGKSDLSYAQMHEVNLEDLLPRDKIEIDMNSIGKQLSGKKILITGAAGSIGSEIVRQVSLFAPAELVLVDQAETPLHDIRLMMRNDYPNINAYTIIADIANQDRMEDIFKNHKLDYIFHAAAYKHVPMMEDNPQESIENNVSGTKILADLAVKYGTKKFVMVSTDKAVNPTNVMGCSKRLCEIYVQSLDKAIKEGKIQGDTQFVTTRFGNVLGSNGSVIPLFTEQIKHGGPITVTHPDIIRFFMLIPEACKLVLEAGAMGKGGEIFVFDMGQPVKIVDLAKRMIQISGVPNIEIKFTGLRDGEKLYEEVLNDKEITLPTFHPKIKIAKVREYDYNEVNSTFCNLIAIGRKGDDMEIVAAMKAIVPEFKSQHSKYEALDKK